MGVVQVIDNASPQEYVALYEMLNRSSQVDRLFGTHKVVGEKYLVHEGFIQHIH